MKTATISTLIVLLSTDSWSRSESKSLPDDTRLVSFDVSVTGKNGQPVTGLGKDNFKVYRRTVWNKPSLEWGRRKSHWQLSFSWNSAKMPLWRMEWNPHEDLLNSLDARDWGAVVAFDSRPDIVVDFTHDKTVLLDGLRRLYTRYFGDSALFDAVCLCGRPDERPGSKGCDPPSRHGRDNMSFNRTYGQALRRAETTDT